MGKYRTKLHIIPLYSAIKFLSKLRFLVEILISNSQKLIEWIDRKVERYSRSEKPYEPIQHNSDLYNFHTTSGYKFYSSSHRL